MNLKRINKFNRKEPKTYETTLNEKKKIKLKIWIQQGQERFHSIQNNYYNQVDGILFIYDITNENIFNIIEEWLKEVKKNENKIL